MKHFATAFTEIIERRHDGNQSAMAKATGVSASTIARFCQGTVEPTLDRLESICAILPRLDRKQLLMAAARDRIPPAYQDEIFGDEDPASQLLRAKLSPDLAAVIRFLESNAMTDELTAAYLRRIGDWVGITSAEQSRIPLKVAEAPAEYNAAAKTSVAK